MNPIAPHNLNIRPLNVPDKASIEISVGVAEVKGI